MQTQSKENLLIASGFQVIVPKTAAQPAVKAMIKYGTKMSWVFQRLSLRVSSGKALAGFT